MNKDTNIVDYITRLSFNEVDPRLMENFTIKIKNVRKYRARINKRISKIKSIIGEK